MPEPPERIEIDSIERLSDRRVVKQMSYIVTGPDVYAVRGNDFEGDVYLELVDEIPEEHWERYDA